MISQKYIDQVKILLSQGKSKEYIYKEFLAVGLNVDSINEIFNLISSENSRAGDKDILQKKVIRVAAIMGALLIGAGLFSFIASNWDGIPDALKILIIVGSMLAVNLAGWFLRQKQGHSKTSEALFLLGAIIYGGGLFLTAQIFNISAGWPDGFIIWMIGVMAMAFALDSFHLFYLAMPISVIIIGGHISDILASSFLNPISSLSKSLFPVILAIAVTFAAGYTIRKRLPEELKKVF